MAGFIRRYENDPGLEVLAEIEGVDIIDRDPPEGIVGQGSGTVVFTGEFEDGPFNTPTTVTSGQDLLSRFGGFGYAKGGLVGVDPCARRRYADSAVLPEYWNGNAAVHLRGKSFRRLIVNRVDTSNGTVVFTRLASVKGTPKTRWNLESGQTLLVSVDGAGAATATFTGVAATLVEASSGSYAMSAGDTLVLLYDDGSSFTVTFTAADTTVAAVVARINQYAGQSIATVDTGRVRLSGIKRGTAGKVQIVSATAGVLPTKINLTVGTTVGTGNVGSIDQVTFTELKTIVEAAVTGSKLEQLEDLTPRLYNSATPGTGTIQVTGGTATDFGFSTTAATAVTSNAGTIPAGTEVYDTANPTRRYLVMQAVPVTAAVAGPYSVKVRFRTDDGSGVGSAAAAITTLVDLATFDAFAVTNLAATDTVSKTEAAIDALYETALEATKNINSDAAEATIEACARQSTAIRAKLLDNSLIASRNGLRGRSCHRRPPLGTDAVVARASSVFGVAFSRSDRAIFNYPGMQVKISEIALRGTAGGTGFTADGLVDVGSDVFAASVRSQLPPEENPAQETEFMEAAVGIESAFAATALGLEDYKAFKAAGIMAPRFASGKKFFQSGVNSVDPTRTNKRNISRRTMADFIQDSMARKADAYSKKPATQARITACRGDFEGFLGALKSESNKSLQRIADYAISEKGNTSAAIAAGIYRYRVVVTLLASLDKIVIDATIGETADVTVLDEAA